MPRFTIIAIWGNTGRDGELGVNAQGQFDNPLRED